MKENQNHHQIIQVPNRQELQNGLRTWKQEEIKKKKRYIRESWRERKSAVTEEDEEDEEPSWSLAWRKREARLVDA